MSIDIEQRVGITHHNDIPNPALPNDKMIYEVKDFMSYFLEMDVPILLIQHTYAYLNIIITLITAVMLVIMMLVGGLREIVLVN